MVHANCTLAEIMRTLQPKRFVFLFAGGDHDMLTLPCINRSWRISIYHLRIRV
jgi:hypothetical protein